MSEFVDLIGEKLVLAMVNSSCGHKSESADVSTDLLFQATAYPQGLAQAASRCKWSHVADLLCESRDRPVSDSRVAVGQEEVCSSVRGNKVLICASAIESVDHGRVARSSPFVKTYTAFSSAALG